VRRLARDACGLVYAVIEAHVTDSLSPTDGRNIESLLWYVTYHSVKRFETEERQDTELHQSFHPQRVKEGSSPSDDPMCL
jgi:ribosomal protein S16